MYQLVLLVDLRENSNEEFSRAFKEANCRVINCQRRLTEIDKQLKKDPSIEMVAVYAKNPNMELLTGIAKIIEDYELPFIVFVDSSTKQLTTEATNIGIAAYIVDGFVPSRIRHIIDLAKARWQDRQATRKELEKTRLSLAERKIIEKAKGILMRRRTIDEQAAYQMMRKMAMDKNQKLAEVAENIIHADTLFN